MQRARAGVTRAWPPLFCIQVHRFADAVSEIVEQSRQELKIDKQLDKIENTWMNLMMEFIPFKSTGVKVIEEGVTHPLHPHCTPFAHPLHARCPPVAYPLRTRYR